MALVAAAEPEVAVMVALPSATEVTSPADETVATLEFDVVQVTATPDMAVPPASFTVATMVTVSLIEVRVFEIGVSETDVATLVGVLGVVGVPVSPPQL